jgi:hypothetical protein
MSSQSSKGFECLIELKIPLWYNAGRERRPGLLATANDGYGRPES